MRKTPGLIVALDVKDLATAVRLVEQLRPAVTLFKVGVQLFTAEGPKAVEAVQQRGGQVFLDLKFHDIPNTVAAGVREAAKMGVVMCTLHASGGRPMLEAAREAVMQSGSPMRLWAVTILTSLDPHGYEEAIGGGLGLQAQVIRLASLARGAGMDGIVASTHEIAPLRAALGPSMLIMTPGVRPEWAPADDQLRVMTPREAAVAGADYLVIGRPITTAPNPAVAARQVLDELHVSA